MVPLLKSFGKTFKGKLNIGLRKPKDANSIMIDDIKINVTQPKTKNLTFFRKKRFTKRRKQMSNKTKVVDVIIKTNMFV